MERPSVSHPVSLTERRGEHVLLVQNYRAQDSRNLSGIRDLGRMEQIPGQA